MRDTNKARLYRAETKVANDLLSAKRAGGKGDERYADVKEATKALRTLRKRYETPEQLAQPLALVDKGKSNTSTYYGWKREIALASGWGFTGLVLCHEYAHHLVQLVADAHAPVRAVPDHGSEFARTFLRTLAGHYGPNSTQVKLMLDRFGQCKVMVDGGVQNAAAWKQVLRLRSDYRKVGGCDQFYARVIFAQVENDYDGHSYVFGTQAIPMADCDMDPGLRPRLRYVEGPMVRRR